MANPGVGNKFMSVNLNKSYGQHQYHHGNQHHSSVSNRVRPGGGVGGGMVVLSRPRSSQKAAGPKLSVPPPLNLPSLRKEHERFDSLGSGAGHAGGGMGSGARPSSSGMGWTKPAAIAIQEKEGLGVGGDCAVDNAANNNRADQGLQGVANVGKGSGSSVYVPPSARSTGPAVSGPSRGNPVAEKATVLRGEDFPSLQATLPTTSGPEKKEKDVLNQKQKQLLSEKLANEQKDGSHFNRLGDMSLQLQSRNNVNNRLDEYGGENRRLSGSVLSEKDQKQDEYFPGLLPLVRLNPRLDWADDERDTGHGLTDQGRDHGFSKNEAYWERKFDFPRPSVLPQKPASNLLDWRGQRDSETGRISSSEVIKVDTYARDVRMPGRDGKEGNSWRDSSFLSKDGFSSQEVGNERNGIVIRSSSLNREPTKESKYIPSAFRDNAQDDTGRRDVGVGYGQGGRQACNNTGDSLGNRGLERSNREIYGSEQYNRYKGDGYPNNSLSKSSFSFSGKGLPINDPILNFGREKRPFSMSEKTYLEDPFMKDFGSTGFDGRDPLSGGLVALVKKKKDVLKQTDFHDPVRESFEAELERVQRMQEQERQRVIEEQERAMELARREEEERMRLAREQEEQQRRLEEEAREAAWKAEQERSEAMRRAEELRIAREEEKQRIFIEEERRKLAAKQKLLELEERIAKRLAEASKSCDNNNSSSSVTDEKMSGMAMDKDVSKMADVDDWEDSERMVKSITASGSSDSSGMNNRPFEMGSRPHLSRDSASGILDRGKPVSPWKRDVFDNVNGSVFHPHDQENGHRSPRRDGSVGGRAYSRQDFYGGPGLMSSRPFHKGGVSDPHMDDYNQIKGQRWNISLDGDYYNRNMEIESEFHDNLAERFRDSGWGQSRIRGNPYPPYNERMYHNPEADGFYSFGRSRYSMRQPRVLPPPSTTSMHRSPYRGENDHPGPSTFPKNEMHYNQVVRNGSSMQTRYDSSHQENLEHTETINGQQENTEKGMQKLDSCTGRCDSQSSLSVSSPPDSPVHLSHDDLDESGDSPVLSAGQGKDVALLGQENESVALRIEAENKNLICGSSVISAGDDEEWTIENDEHLQEQEEYDEDEDGYEEEDEVHDGEDENINLSQEFEDMHIEAKGSDMIDNLVLGFNEGVEVVISGDEFERSLRNEETNFVMPQISVGFSEERGSIDGMCSDGQTIQPVDGSSQVSIDDSSRIFQETEKAMQDLVIQPKNATQTSAVSELIDHVDASSGSGLSTQPQVPSSAGETVLPSVPSALNQPEVPVKLQFGLFSGPSLIPSPVRAIQIGSIQMPLHLHPPVGSSLTHMHPSQHPFFQFGQLKYTSSISQGVLPLAPQSMSFVQPGVATNFSLNQNVGHPLPIQHGHDTSVNNLLKSDALSTSMDNQPGLLPRQLDLSYGISSNGENSLPPRESTDSTSKTRLNRGEHSLIGDNNLRPESGFQPDESYVKNFKALPARELEGPPQAGASSSQSVSKEKDLGVSRAQGLISGGRGKRYVFTVKSSGSESSFPAPEGSRPDSSGFQRRPRRMRTEFRVRESADKRQSSGLITSNIHGVDDEFNVNDKGARARSGSRRVIVSNRQPKQALESEGSNSRPASSREMNSGRRAEKGTTKESLRKSQNIAHSGEDVDAPLQSGIVRVFEQPGIEAPSDDDDFIKVRSKRQMLNDRREQREKERKAKTRVSKMLQRRRSVIGPVTSNKKSASVGGEASNSSRSGFVVTEGHSLASIEVSAGFSPPMVSVSLPPIGTPAVKMDTQADTRSQTVKSLQASSIPNVSGGGNNLASGLAPVGSWGNSRLNKQVMALTQTQLDDAMKPVQFDTHASVGDSANSVSEAGLPPSSILTKDDLFSSASSPINSLLAGEKIQFGAVTSPTILPSSSSAVSHGIGPPSLCRSDIQISHTLSTAENDCPLFFEKEKHTNESCAHLEDREAEAEAEAAASAVAVAAISSDEIVGNGLGTGPVATTDSKTFGSEDIDGITAGGVSGEQQLSSQSRAEESLSVALPADLSVETPPISLWPPLPSPQNSSSQMLSHVPGGPPPQFPFYEMNPMLGGPIFAFSPHDESASTQSQSQKSSIPVSGPLGAWQHRSGVDSFYGPPAGFTGPFISPPGSIPGVQGPPHMVVYNHFAPVGQYGQVGLSFMGTTFIPSGKQPDWKHSPASSTMGVGEADMNNLSMVSSQRNPPNMSAPIQHLAPGSPLLPMASPLAMFDVSPFQSTHEMSVQACWSQVPASSLQSVPVSMSLQQQAEGVPSQFNLGPPVDQPLAANRFPESQMATRSDNGQNFSVPTNTKVAQLPDDLALLDSSSSTGAGTSTQNTVAKSSSASTIPEHGKTDLIQNGSSSNSSGQNTSSAFKTQPSHQKNTSAQQFSNSAGYNYQRGGAVSQKNSSGGEWSHRRMGGYQGRNQSLGAEKSVPPSKMKQIYVAKQTTGGTSTTS